MNEQLHCNSNWASPDHREIKHALGHVALHGIVGFHPVEEVEDHAVMASQVMDRDAKGRVNTGTGEQPSNSPHSRFGTDCTSE